MIGKTISHYKILSKLGEGGMGVVYKARDAKLDRFVALKFLPSHLTKNETDLRRFIQEAKAAAALNHPNVCTIYEIHDEGEQPFIAMEYVEGRTLRQIIHDNLPKVFDLREVANYPIQIAEALKAAHANGIIHRDIKSDNIMVTGAGRIKVMDFGVAKLRNSADLTKSGSTIGTVAYMSPEQARGDEIDQRSDIWSLGVVMYEMLTGRLPFQGEYEQAVVYSILHDEPEMPSGIPSDLKGILNRCLEKRPARRYKDTGSLMESLYNVNINRENTAVRTRPQLKIILPGIVAIIAACIAVYVFFIHHAIQKTGADAGTWSYSIAVLPFADMSEAKDQEFFCDGMAEEILNTLTHIEKLRVIARTSAFAFKGKNMDVREIGRQLGVETLLEGSVRKAGDRLRVTAQLIRTEDGAHLWSDQFDRNLTDVFAIQDEIALAIVNKLKIKLLGHEEERVSRRLTENLDAYHQYLRGRHILNRRKAEDIYTAIAYFEKALALDSLYVMGYAGLSDAYALLPSYAGAPAEMAYAKAKEYINRALMVNDQVGEAYASLGWIRMLADWDWPGAEKAFRKGMDLNPGYATLNHWYGYLYMILGEFDKSLVKVQRALELDPLSPVINRVVGDVYYNAGQYEKAIPAFQKCLELEPCLPFAHLLLSGCYTKTGLFSDGLEEIQKIKGCVGQDYTGADYAQGMIYVSMGETEKARQVLHRLVGLGEKSTGLARLYFKLGEKEKGYQMLEALCDDHNTWIIYINSSPDFDSVRHEPRFQALLKKVGFSL